MNGGWLVVTALVAMFVGFFIVGFTFRRIRRGGAPELVALPLAILVIAAISVGFYFITAGSVSNDPASDAATPARELRLFEDGVNLVVQPGNANSYVRDNSWRLYDGGKVSAAVSSTLTAGQEMRSQPIFARSREQFHISYTATGSGSSQAVCLWEDEGHADGRPGDANLGSVESKPVVAGQFAYFTCAAPQQPTLSNLRVILRQREGSATFSNLRVASDDLRVSPWPNGARAALAFSFDWESAMGGPIHSRGMAAHDVASAVAEGGRMRKGADILLELFAQANISATFYATGYNLIDGNTERKAYLNNPTYKWASPEFGWGSDFWTKNGWYADDPFSTASDPAGQNWYFGDQLDRITSQGHEVASHTFGHLYVRGASPDELRADLEQWRVSARAQGITATTFAYPWRSSNSTKADYYAVLREAGFRAVTRLYEPDMRYPFQFATAPDSGGMLVVPDFLLGQGSGEENSGSDGGTLVKSVSQAAEIMDAAVALNGVTSFWQHPSALTDPATDQLWDLTIATAEPERNSGRMWIAPIGEIVSYHEAVRQVVTVVRGKKLTADGYDLIVEVGNYSQRDLRGLTLTVDGDITALKVIAEAKDKPVDVPARPDGNRIILDVAARKSVQVQVSVKR